MPRLTNVIADQATRLLTRDVVVTAADDLTHAFRRIDLAGGPLTSANWSTGQKVQVRIEGFTFRTYTPFAWSGDRVSLLSYRHGGGPASDWVVGIEPGDRCQIFGPRRSLDLASLVDAPIMVGDETSFALSASGATTPPEHPSRSSSRSVRPTTHAPCSTACTSAAPS